MQEIMWLLSRPCARASAVSERGTPKDLSAADLAAVVGWRRIPGRKLVCRRKKSIRSFLGSVLQATTGQNPARAGLNQGRGYT